MKFEDKFPFVATIVGGLIAWLATLLFVREYAGLMTIVILIALILFRYEPWAFIGSFLIGLAIETHNSGGMRQFTTIVLLLIGGSVLQIAVYYARGLSTSTVQSFISLWQRMFYVMLGMSVVHIIRLATCEPTTIDSEKLLQIVVVGGDCHYQGFIDYAKDPANRSNVTSYLNSRAILLFLQVIMSPGLWGCILLSLRQINFNILRFGTFLSLVFKSWLGLFASFLFFIPFYIIIGTPLSIFIEMFVPSIDTRAESLSFNFILTSAMFFLFKALGVSLLNRGPRKQQQT